MKDWHAGVVARRYRQQVRCWIICDQLKQLWPYGVAGALLVAWLIETKLI